MNNIENKLRKHAETTKKAMATPFKLEEIIKGEEETMNKPKISFKRAVPIVAALALCLVAVCITPLASEVGGFFRDIIRFDGAITGTRYENATNEISVDVLNITSENGNVIVPLKLTFENPNAAPFPYIQEVAIAEYKITDSNNKELIKEKLSAEDAEKGAVTAGEVLINLSVSDKKLKPGEEYTIIIEKMYGLSKADAPLHIKGMWKCNFSK